MKIADLLTPESVLLDLRAANKRQLLEKLASRLAPTLGIDPAAALAALLHREALGSTGMGDGIALPHARIAQVGRPAALLARLRPAIDFESLDGNPVDLVFLLLVPERDGGLGLNALACMARRVREAAVAQGLRRARSGDEAFAILAADDLPLADQ